MNFQENERDETNNTKCTSKRGLTLVWSNLIFNLREGFCGCNGAAMSSHCAEFRFTSLGWVVVGGGEETAVLPARTTSARDKKWQAFNGSFWRWLLYYSGSANLTWPNEDLAPRHLLVSHFIMSSSPVHACPGIMGVCLSESPRQQGNIDWTVGVFLF